MVNKLLDRWWFVPALVVIGLALLLAYVPPALGVKTAYLLTDRLIFLLLAVVLFFASYVRRKEHLLAPWRRVFQRKLALVALVVLSVYVVIGLLDSVHFRTPLAQQGPQEEVHYSVEVTSLLDVVLAPLRTRGEKTYSAPFALHLHTKEILEQPDGSHAYIYPRLEHGGAHLQGVEERAGDIARTLGVALPQAVIVWLLGVGLLALVLARRQYSAWLPLAGRILRGDTALPWHMIVYTVLVLLLLAFAAAHLGAKYHVFGTDKVGVDVFYLSLKSVRTGLVIGTLTTLVMLPFAIVLGIMAGFFRGWVDDIIQYTYTTLNSIPGVLLIAAAILSIQVYIANHPELFETVADRSDLRLLALCIILGITSWTGLCRLLRGETLKLREMDYIQAATAFGVGKLTIIGRHIVPNVMHIVLIIVVLDFSGLVLAEAVLSYVGVGVDPSMASWGNMINSARLELAREPVVWWSLAAAFVMMFALVLAANLVADAVRDAFDPRLRTR